MKRLRVFVVLVGISIVIGCGQIAGCATVRGIFTSASSAYDSPAVSFYEQTENGTYRRLNSAIAFEKGEGENVYRLVVAAQYVAQDNELLEKVHLRSKSYFISFDEADKTSFFEVKILAAGYQKRGDNFAVVEARLNRKMSLSKEIAEEPTFKKFWREVQDGRYQWFNLE